MARTVSHSFAALTREILFLPLEHKIHIFSPPCNILYISDDTKTLVGLLICNFGKRWRHMKTKNSSLLFSNWPKNTKVGTSLNVWGCARKNIKTWTIISKLRSLFSREVRKLNSNVRIFDETQTGIFQNLIRHSLRLRDWKREYGTSINARGRSRKNENWPNWEYQTNTFSGTIKLNAWKTRLEHW